MTNAEIYIGDEDMIDEFIEQFTDFFTEHQDEGTTLKELLVQFFKAEANIEQIEDSQEYVEDFWDIRTRMEMFGDD